MKLRLGALAVNQYAVPGDGYHQRSNYWLDGGLWQGMFGVHQRQQTTATLCHNVVHVIHKDQVPVRVKPQISDDSGFLYGCSAKIDWDFWLFFKHRFRSKNDHVRLAGIYLEAVFVEPVWKLNKSEFQCCDHSGQTGHNGQCGVIRLRADFQGMAFIWVGRKDFPPLAAYWLQFGYLITQIHGHLRAWTSQSEIDPRKRMLFIWP